MTLKNNLIVNQFRAAGRLVNEWRDTLTYAAVASYAAYNVLHSGHPGAALPNVLHKVMEFSFWREAGRSYSWSGANEHRVVGDVFVPLDHQKLVNAARAACFVANGIEWATSGTFGMAVNVFFTGAFCALAGGPREVVEAYIETMWDWPRKKGGRGPTQTEKLKAGFSELGQIAVPVLQPSQAANCTIGGRENLQPLPTGRGATELNF